MKKLHSALAVFLVAIIAFNCQKEVRSVGGNNNNQPPGNSTDTKKPITATLQGNVKDEKGQPAIGVTIKTGNATVTTNAKGYFRITDADLDKNVSLVSAEKTGYFKAYRSFSATSGVNQVMIQLIKKTNAGTVNATSGGNVSLSNGSVISLPANGIMKGGAAYSGTVNVFASYIDPVSNDISENVPGSFMGTDKDNKRVTLSSYGMLAVELETPGGEKLQLASGQTASLTIPVPASIQSSAPASIPLWYLDEQTGVWKEEGSATRNGNSYTGTVKHFSFWNCDVGVPVVGFSLTLHTPEGGPLTYTSVRIRATSGYVGNAYGVTDSLGQVSGLIPANMSLILEVLNPCNGVAYSQNIGPYTSAVNLGTISVNTSVSMLTIKGKIVNCSNAAVTNGHALIKYDNIVRYVTANNAGEFSLTFTTCNTAPATCEITAYDETAQQQGTATNVTITTPVTNAGTLTACGTSTQQYINYTLDGVNYSISSSQNDSLLAYTSQFGGAVPMRLTLMGSHTGSANVEAVFDCTASAGTYPLNHRLVLNNYQRIGVIAPFDVVITNFPQSIGGYYEGTFSGQFRDTADLAPLHNVSATFRIAKYW